MELVRSNQGGWDLVVHVTHIRQMINADKILVESLKGRDHLED
jgi:hypothetical protein